MTTATETSAQGISIDIPGGPVTHDVGSRSNGWYAYVWLNPEARSATLYTCIGVGMPFHVYHHRSLLVVVNAAADGGAIGEILDSHRETIEKIFDLYEGSEWDGSNHVGIWSDKDTREDLRSSLKHALADAPTYWDARDWFAGATSETYDDIGQAHAHGEEAVSKLVKRFVSEASGDDVLLDSDDVAKYVAGVISRIEQKGSDEDEGGQWVKDEDGEHVDGEES